MGMVPNLYRAALVAHQTTAKTYHTDMARIKQNGILGQLLRDSWLAFTEGLL